MLKSHNKMKYVILISFLLLFIKCKGQNSSEEVRTSKNDTIILSSGIYVLTPNDKEIRDLKLKHGDENFYVIADDANYYMAEISGLSKIKITYPRFSKLVFKEEGFILDKSKYDNNWLVIDYHKGDKPKIYSLLDYYLSLNEKSKSKESTSTKSIKTEGSSLVVNNKYFDDLIVNAMSLTTNLEIIDETLETYRVESEYVLLKNEGYRLTFKNIKTLLIHERLADLIDFKEIHKHNNGYCSVPLTEENINQMKMSEVFSYLIEKKLKINNYGCVLLDKFYDDDFMDKYNQEEIEEIIEEPIDIKKPVQVVFKPSN